MSAIEDIAAERQRQIEAEGWSHDHDDIQTNNELSFAGAIYALNASMNGGEQTVEAHKTITDLWPWTRDWWKPTTRRRDLVKAGALIVAEIDRLDRLEKSKT